MAIKSQFIEAVYQMVQQGVTDNVTILAELKDTTYPDVYLFNVDSALHQINIGVYPSKEEDPEDECDIVQP
ncbi:hypothetical protein NVP1244A_066 [Vibrio phage 1.244.A._10N.261.54.C3]|nr:hypothetical protein NVP1244A_066 [Vibrio phage 1.244.A._10N.261.54.C3]AUR98694.1 hypothetical protein NVP1255O_066 [Vibrio phage 1.255.O._10N.286.45.F1]